MSIFLIFAINLAVRDNLTVKRRIAVMNDEDKVGNRQNAYG